MKTSDVRVGQRYLYKGQETKVLEKVRGKLTTQPNMQSGILFTGFKRRRKRFLLCSGDKVYSHELECIKEKGGKP